MSMGKFGCFLFGHDWDDVGMMTHECSRCGRTVAEWMVKTGGR